MVDSNHRYKGFKLTNRTALTKLIKDSFVEMMKDVATSTVGHIIAFDPDTQLAQIQVGIVGIKADGETFELTPLIECLVYFNGGDYLVETQIDPNVEGVILFSQRCIDGWVNTGGIADNPILRFHDMQDAMFLPGMRSQPNKITNFQNNGIRLRDKAGANYVWLKNDGTVEIKATSVKIVGDTAITGDMSVTGDAAVKGDVTATNGTISLTTHTHQYVNTLPNGTVAPVTTTGPSDVTP